MIVYLIFIVIFICSIILYEIIMQLKIAEIETEFRYEDLNCDTVAIKTAEFGTPVITKTSESNTYLATIGQNKLKFLCNIDVTNPSSASNTCIVFQMIHGIDRTAKGYFSMANNAWGKNPNTLVWAPRFPIQSEATDNENYWSTMGWVTGDESNGPGKMPSFQFLDSINSYFFKTFPIKTAILAGHSGGGQSTARYTGVSYLPEMFPNVKIYYCIIAPSTYLWLTPDRPKPSDCSKNTNNWFWGLDRLNTYAAMMGSKNIYCNYMKRNVIVMCGTEDTGTGMLDTSCQANTQGANRFERAKNFAELMTKLQAKNFQYEWYKGGHGPNLRANVITTIMKNGCS